MPERKDFAGIEPSMLTLKVSALSFMPRSLEQNTSWAPIGFKCHFKQSNCKKNKQTGLSLDIDWNIWRENFEIRKWLQQQRLVGDPQR